MRLREHPSNKHKLFKNYNKREVFKKGLNIRQFTLLFH